MWAAIVITCTPLASLDLGLITSVSIRSEAVSSTSTAHYATCTQASIKTSLNKNRQRAWVRPSSRCQSADRAAH
ncbi:hypothetical protein F4808DRAFT_443742 [Astrocystis sublimbata]|nr:hypothetical protein F4808DRAFT_443742 [Astrocystis sublimbata]